MTVPVFDLLFGESADALCAHPRGIPQSNQHAAYPGAIRAGWVGGKGPAIQENAWPRSPVTGFPMIHLLTLELPAEYRRKGPELGGIAFFQADDHVAQATPGAAEALTTGNTASGAAFFTDLVRAHASRHPEAIELKDMLAASFSLLWLREGELRGARTAPPPDTRTSVPLPETGQNLNAWDHAQPELSVWLVERDFDPNAGKAPVETWDEEQEDEDEDATPAEYVPSQAYVDVVLSEVPKLAAFFKAVHGRSHLGGSCLPVQAMPEGLTPFFLELEDGVGGANFGGGNMQLDLESGVFDWAC